MKKKPQDQTHYDVIVVGSGAAGCVVAAHIAENSALRVALIEAGGMDGNPLVKLPAGFAKILQHDKFMWRYETVPVHGARRAYRSGKIIGGGTSVNAMCYVRGQPEDYDAWHAVAGKEAAWSYRAMLPHFLAQEGNDLRAGPFHGTEGPLKTRMTPMISDLNALCVRAFQEYGLPFNDDYNGASQRGVSPVQVNIHDGRRCSAVDAYLREHIRSGRVTLITDAFVTKVLFEENRASGVEVQIAGNTLILRADEVILSAGAIQSPRILMHSGIGPADALRSNDILVRVASEEVGENLQDHPIFCLRAYVKGDLGYQKISKGLGAARVGLRYLLTKDGPAAGNCIETVSHWDPRDLSGRPTVQCYHVPVISEDGLVPTGSRSGVTLELVLLQPKSRGWVRLGGKDPAAMPLINPNFVGHEDDLALAVEAVKAGRSILQQPAFREVIEEELEPGAAQQSDEEIAAWVKKVVNTMWHPVGTCRMGDDEHSVVDGRLRVRGVTGLRVIDASIMPELVSGNTSAPTQALARNGVMMFLEDRTRQIG